MEAFEQFVAAAMESENLVVSSAVKFPVRRRTKKQAYAEYQTHGYEVDLDGANAEKLVLATVKSFFGSHGVTAADVKGEGGGAGGYRLLNDKVIRDGVIKKAKELYGYDPAQIYMRLYVGRFAGTGQQQTEIEEWCGRQKLRSGPIEVVTVREVVDALKTIAAKKTYFNNASIVALKVLEAAGEITLPTASG